MSSYVTAQGQRIALGRKLGEGGQGAVYALPNQPSVVAKIYLQKPDSATSRKLEALAAVADVHLLAISAWPQAVLKDDSGTTWGFVMPVVGNPDYQEVHNLYRTTSRRQHFPAADWRFQVHVARNIARAFASLHDRGHLMGDVSPRNVMVSQNGTVRFIDTDSFQIAVHGITYPCPVGTADHTPPELQGQRFGQLVRTLEHDQFGLAVIIFHLLTDGRHPYAGVHTNGAAPSPAEAIASRKFAFSLIHQHGVSPPPFSLTLKSFHPDLRELFERAFGPKDAGRPSALEWERTLAELAGHLTTCTRVAEHKHDRRLPCPWCGMLPANAAAATSKSGMPSRVKRIDSEAELNRIWQGVRAVTAPSTPIDLPLPTNLAPLPLPAMPPPPTVPSANDNAAAVIGVTCLLLTLGGLMQGWSWYITAGLFIASLYYLSRNAPARVEARQAVMTAKLRADAYHAYQAQWAVIAQEHEREADQLRRQLSQARNRQQANSAQSRYRTELKRLEDLRSAIRLLEQTEQKLIKEMIEGHRRPLLEQYLSTYVITAGSVPGIGPAVIASLNQQRVYTAKDITPNVRYIKGVGPRREQDLMMWRDSVEQFFQFDPNLIPLKDYDSIVIKIDQDKLLKLKSLEDSIQKFINESKTWRFADEAIQRDIYDLRLQLAQREKTVDFIRRGVSQLN